MVLLSYTGRTPFTTYMPIVSQWAVKNKKKCRNYGARVGNMHDRAFDQAID
jgi:hypothetical protein